MPLAPSAFVAASASRTPFFLRPLFLAAAATADAGAALGAARLPYVSASDELQSSLSTSSSVNVNRASSASSSSSSTATSTKFLELGRPSNFAVRMSAASVGTSASAISFAGATLTSSLVASSSDYALSFFAPRPISDNHMIVASKRPVQRISDLSPAEEQAMWKEVQNCCRILTAEFGAQGFNIGLGDGEEAHQSVPHAYIHVIGRVPGDFAKSDDVFTQIDAHNASLTLAEDAATIQARAQKAERFRAALEKRRGSPVEEEAPLRKEVESMERLQV